jgi:hypothetical protein
LIVSRYLKRQRSLTREALERLAEEAPPEEEEVQSAAAGDEEEQKVERPLGPHEQRLGTVLSVLRGIGAKLQAVPVSAQGVPFCSQPLFAKAICSSL